MRLHENKEIQAFMDEIESLSIEIVDEKAFLKKLAVFEERADRDHDRIAKAFAVYHKASLPYKRVKFEECRKYTKEALQISKEVNLTYMILRCYNTLAILDSEQRDYYESITNYLNAYHIAESHPEYQYGSYILNNIGNLFVWLNEHEMALDFLEKAFHKYYEEKNDRSDAIEIIVMNIIEEYSILKQYDHIARWLLEPITHEDIQACIQLILLVNEADHLYAQHDHEKIDALLSNVLQFPCDENNYIYVFRSNIRMLAFAIEAMNESHASQLISNMEELGKVAAIESFRHDFMQLKYRYYEAFEEARSEDSSAKRILKEYVMESQNALLQMKNTYTRRLIMETELLKTRNEMRTVEYHNLQLQKDIELDYFTRILNKVSFEQHFAIKNQQMVPGSMQVLLLVDIDHFKQVNDTYGHERGDELILQVVHRISALCTPKMMFGRFGGDEFLLLMESVSDLTLAKEFINEILVQARKINIAQETHITLSIGAYVCHQPLAFKEVFELVDQALYQAKRAGRDQFFMQS